MSFWYISCILTFIVWFQNVVIDACVLENDSGLLQQVSLFFFCFVCELWRAMLVGLGERTMMFMKSTWMHAWTVASSFSCCMYAWIQSSSNKIFQHNYTSMYIKHTAGILLLDLYFVQSIGTSVNCFLAKIIWVFICLE